MALRSRGRLQQYGVIALFATATVCISLYAAGFAIDLTVYYPMARYVLPERRILYGPDVGLPWPMWYRYPPLFLFLFYPFALLPVKVAAFVWTILKSLVLAGLMRALTQRLGGIPPWQWTLVACIAGPYVVTEFRYGNAQFFVFALAGWALLTLGSHPIRAAALLGFAISLKVWPVYFVPYLAVRGRIRVAAVAVLIAALLTMLPALYYGWSEHLDLLVGWYEQESAIARNAAHMWFPSQSLLGVAARYLTEIDYAAMPDPGYPVINVAGLDVKWLYRFWAVVALLGYGSLLWLARRSHGRAVLAVHALAFCALVLLQPYSQKQSALVVLIWPAIVVASGNPAERPAWSRVSLYAAALIGGFQPLVPVGTAQRLFQVMGLDALLTILLAVSLLPLTSPEGEKKRPGATLSGSVGKRD